MPRPKSVIGWVAVTPANVILDPVDEAAIVVGIETARGAAVDLRQRSDLLDSVRTAIADYRAEIRNYAEGPTQGQVRQSLARISAAPANRQYAQRLRGVDEFTRVHLTRLGIDATHLDALAQETEQLADRQDRLTGAAAQIIRALDAGQGPSLADVLATPFDLVGQVPGESRHPRLGFIARMAEVFVEFTGAAPSCSYDRLGDGEYSGNFLSFAVACNVAATRDQPQSFGQQVSEGLTEWRKGARERAKDEATLR